MIHRNNNNPLILPFYSHSCYDIIVLTYAIFLDFLFCLPHHQPEIQTSYCAGRIPSHRHSVLLKSSNLKSATTASPAFFVLDGVLQRNRITQQRIVRRIRISQHKRRSQRRILLIARANRNPRTSMDYKRTQYCCENYFFFLF